MMLRYIIICLFVCACNNTQAQTNIITTIAGKAWVSASDSGDGGQAINARLFAPESLCLDKFGNIIIADAGNNKIRKINIVTGFLTTIAGIDSGGYSGDGGLATNAMLWIPSSIAIDTVGNIYIADGRNHRIRRIIIATGIITTIAGNGIAGNLGDNGLATNAQLNGPVGLCFDKLANLYIADYFNDKIRMVEASSGNISTFAGSGIYGYTGDGGQATNAAFSSAIQVFADNSNNIFICDQFNSVVRKVDALSGIITTIAGTGVAGYRGDGGLAINAKLNEPAGGYVTKENDILIAEFRNGVVRKINGSTGIITTVAGNGTWGWAGDGGAATDAELSCTQVVIDKDGSMIIADYGTNTIRKVYNPKLGTPPILSEGAVKIYPNPATDELTIENAAGSEVRIFNLLGQEVCKKVLSSNSEVLGIANLVNGVYMVQVMDAEGKSRNERLVVAR
jgi:hypothetical protein